MAWICNNLTQTLTLNLCWNGEQWIAWGFSIAHTCKLYGVRTLLVNISLSVHNIWHSNWGAFTVLCGTHCKNWREKCLSLTATLVLVMHGRSTTGSHAEYVTPHSEKVPMQKESDKCWLMGYCVRCPAHTPHTAHCTSSMVNTCMYHESLFPSEYDAALQKCICKAVSNPDIPSVQEKKTSTAKAILDIFVGATVLAIITTVQAWLLFFNYLLWRSLSMDSPHPNQTITIIQITVNVS